MLLCHKIIGDFNNKTGFNEKELDESGLELDLRPELWFRVILRLDLQQLWIGLGSVALVGLHKWMDVNAVPTVY